MLCSVDSQHGALAELYRVIRPGGHLRFLEHVAAETLVLRGVQQVADATVWPLLAGGVPHREEHARGDPRVGFEITTLRRLRFPEHRVPVPAAPHALGIATRPGS